MPQIMPRPADADIFHDLHIQRCLIHLDPPYTTHTLTQHIIVNNQALKTKAKK